MPTPRIRRLRPAALLLCVFGSTLTCHAADSPAADPPAKEKLICHLETPLGSRIPAKVCRTRAALDAERQATQNELNRKPAQTGRRGT
jgi:hypothetical protein